MAVPARGHHDAAGSGAAHARLLVPGPRATLRGRPALGRSDDVTAAVPEEDHLYLRKLENRRRIGHHPFSSELPAEPGEVEQLAMRVGHDA